MPKYKANQCPDCGCELFDIEERKVYAHRLAPSGFKRVGTPLIIVDIPECKGKIVLAK